MKTEVQISKICGLCYGSNNAINKTRETLEKEKNVVIYKEILHNQNVIKELVNNGVILKNDINEINPNDFVIIRTHGEPYCTFSYFKRKNIRYLDCTCPNVKTINYLVKEKDESGYKIIIIGKRNHPEVIGTSGWCTSPILIENKDDLKTLNLSLEKYYLVVQTTFSKDKAELLIKKIKHIMDKSNKIFEYRNTICNAQKNINLASIDLAKNVDIVIVLGGKNSSNSKELFANVSAIKEAYFIENPYESLELIENKKIIKGKRIGITAGASTLKEDILKTKELIENKLK